MTVVDLLARRKAVRAYQDREVNADLIRKIFTDAQMSASNCNTQPWHVAIISGDARARLSEQLLTQITAGEQPNPVFQPGDYGLSDVYKARQVACAKVLYAKLGIDRSDKVQRFQQTMENWKFFGAPHVAIFSMPKLMKEVNALDVGIYLQSVMLLMVENGLACCPQGALAFYPDPIMQAADIPEENGILCGLSFGYEEQGATINQVRTERAAFDEFASMIH